MATDEVDSFLRGVASAPPLRPPPRVGEKVGDRYVIEAFLGEGGMGSVYRALDEKLGEPVALKVLKPGFDETVLRDEVRLAQKVTHVNVCRTFDLEEVDGRQIIKMEYLAGETLAKRLAREGKLAVAEAVRIARAIAAGLAAAHARGIVHSDLKPANVMLAADRVALMDFGVAHIASSPGDGAHGTIGYLAPEKLQFRSGDARSDYFALGCVLYEMLAGTPAYAGRGRDAAPPIRANRPGVPHWLARAVGRMLAEDPAIRELGVRGLALGPSPVRIVVPVALLAVAAVAVGWKLARSPAWTPRIWNAESHIENVDEASVSPDGQWIVFTTDRYSGKAGGDQLALVSLATRETFRLDSPTPGEVRRTARWTDRHTLIFVAESKVGRRLYRQAIAFDPPRFVGTGELISPLGVTDVVSGEVCGDAFAYVRWTVGGPMELWSTSSEHPLFRGPGTRTLSEARCDRSGDHIATVLGNSFFGAGDLYVIDRRTGAKRQLTNDASIEGVASFTSDGSSIVMSQRVGQGRQLYELPVAGGDRRRLTFDDQPDLDPDVSRDGRIATFTRDTSVFLVTITGKPGYVTNESASHIRPRAVDIDHLVTQRDGNGPSEIALVQISTGDVQRLAEGTDPFPSFDRRTIFFVPRDRRYLAAVPTGGGPVRYVASLPGQIVGGCGGADGAHVLVQIGDQQASYRVDAMGEITDDHRGGIVCVASSGWRAITTLANASHHSVQLALEAPDGRTQTLDVHSLFNRWLDDHRVTYCLRDCRVLDVLTNQTTILSPPTSVDGILAIVTDDLRVVDWAQDARSSLHAITNFADR